MHVKTAKTAKTENRARAARSAVAAPAPNANLFAAPRAAFRAELDATAIDTAGGRATIVGRSKDLIISDGYNVYPAGIESLTRTNGTAPVLSGSADTILEQAQRRPQVSRGTSGICDVAALAPRTPVMPHSPKEGPSIEALVRYLAQHYYEVVPDSLRTYCAVTSRITQAVLHAYGLPARLTPCQVWYVTPGHNHVVGFLGQDPVPGKWDGHVACTVGPWMIDAAISQYQRDFGLVTPWVVLTQPFRVRSRVIARLDLGPDRGLWWHEPPGGLDLTPPAEPEALVETHARALIAYLDSRLGPAGADSTSAFQDQLTTPRTAQPTAAQASSTLTVPTL